MGVKIVAENKKARFDFFITDRYECGIALEGSEVKSVRLGHMNLRDAFCLITGDGEVMLKNCYIAPYEKGAAFNPEPRRDRKLLLTKKEIITITNELARKGSTLVAIRLFFNEKGRAKLEIGLGVGKKLYDKRETAKDRDWARDKRNIMKNFK